MQFRVGGRSSERSDLMLQIDGDAYLVEEVDAENAVEFGEPHPLPMGQRSMAGNFTLLR
jgi:hypothetical protein